MTPEEKQQLLCTWVADGNYEQIESLLRSDDVTNTSGGQNTSRINIDCRDEKGRTPLIIASERGYSAIVQLLINHHANVNLYDSDGCTPIHGACGCGDYNTAKMLIDNHANVMGSNVRRKQLPLTLAAQNGHFKIVQLLLENHANVNAEDSYSTALASACRVGYYDIVQLLIKNHANVNHFCSLPLHTACESGHLDIVKLLIDNNADVNAQKLFSGNLPIHSASFGGHCDIVQFLLDHRYADIDSRTVYYGCTAIHLACLGGHLDTVQFLLHYESQARATRWTASIYQAARSFIWKRSDNYCRSNNEITPLHMACLGGRYDIVKLLLVDYNVDVHSKDKLGRTPLHYAAGDLHHYSQQTIWRNRWGRIPFQFAGISHCYSSPSSWRYLDPFDCHSECRASVAEHCKVVQILLENGALVNMKDGDGRTPLHGASGEMIQLLLEKHADVHVEDNEGWTPLHFSADIGDVEGVQLLLDHKATALVQSNEGSTPLHCSSLSGHVKVSRLLIEKNQAIVNIQNKKGVSALHVASYAGWPEIVQLLLENYANIWTKDNVGETAEEKARKRVMRIFSQISEEKQMIANYLHQESKLATLRRRHTYRWFLHTWAHPRVNRLAPTSSTTRTA